MTRTLDEMLARFDVISKMTIADDDMEVNDGAIQHARKVLTEAVHLGLPIPYLYPTFDGDVLAEWTSMAPASWSCEVKFMAESAEFFACLHGIFPDDSDIFEVKICSAIELNQHFRQYESWAKQTLVTEEP